MGLNHIVILSLQLELKFSWFQSLGSEVKSRGKGQAACLNLNLQQTSADVYEVGVHPLEK